MDIYAGLFVVKIKNKILNFKNNMKRAALNDLFEGQKRADKKARTYYKKRQQWVRLVRNFECDAIPELCKILNISYNDSLQLDTASFFKCNVPLLFDNGNVYLYDLDGTIFQGNNNVKYPITNKFLWPWTADNKAIKNIDHNIAFLICKYLKTYDIVHCCGVSQLWRKCFTTDIIWKLQFDKLYGILPNNTNTDLTLFNQYMSLPMPPIPTNNRMANKIRKRWFKSQSKQTITHIVGSLLPTEFQIYASLKLVVGFIELDSMWIISVSDGVKICTVEQPAKSLKIFYSYNGYHLKSKMGTTYQLFLRDYAYKLQGRKYKPTFQDWR